MDEMFVNVILDISSDEFYRAKRYKSPLTLILVENTHIDLFDMLDNNSRRLDIIQQLGRDTIVIALTHTSQNEAELYIKKIEKVARIEANITFISYIKQYDNTDTYDFVRKLLSNFCKITDINL